MTSEITLFLLPNPDERDKYLGGVTMYLISIKVFWLRVRIKEPFMDNYYLIPPRRYKRNDKTHIARRGCRFKNGLASKVTPECRWIFHRIYSTPPSNVRVPLISRSTDRNFPCTILVIQVIREINRTGYDITAL